MSIEETPRGGFRARVRIGGKHLSKTITPAMEPSKTKRRKMAEAWERQKIHEREAGVPQVADPRKTLNHLIHDFDRVVIAQRAPKTQRLYRSLWNAHLHSAFGEERITGLTPGRIEAWVAESDAGIPTKIKALILLGQFYKFAMKRGDAATNPVWLVDRPKAPAREPVLPPTPLEVERARKRLLEMGRPGDALLVSLIAYAGTRPSEGLQLVPDDVGERTLLVRAPKTSTYRSVDILDPLREDLAAWDGANGALIPRPEGGPWSPSMYHNWRRRVWGEVADFQPKAMRHTFVSLLLRDESYSRREVAEQAGHTLSMQDRNYAHVFKELRGTGNAVEAIREARQAVFG